MQQRIETEAEAYRQSGIDREMEAERGPQAIGALLKVVRDQGRSPPPRASPPVLSQNIIALAGGRKQATLGRFDGVVTDGSMTVSPAA
jgi:hypothetical protein